MLMSDKAEHLNRLKRDHAQLLRNATDDLLPPGAGFRYHRRLPPLCKSSEELSRRLDKGSIHATAEQVAEIASVPSQQDVRRFDERAAEHRLVLVRPKQEWIRHGEGVGHDGHRAGNRGPIRQRGRPQSREISLNFMCAIRARDEFPRPFWLLKERPGHTLG